MEKSSVQNHVNNLCVAHLLFKNVHVCIYVELPIVVHSNIFLGCTVTEPCVAIDYVLIFLNR